MSAAFWAKVARDVIAAVSTAGEGAHGAADMNGCTWENRVRGSIAGNFLAYAAPTDSRNDRLAGDAVLDVAAKTSSGSLMHVVFAASEGLRCCALLCSTKNLVRPQGLLQTTSIL